jgi:hypothetical protein
MNKLVAEIRCSMDRAMQKKKQKDPNQPVFEYDSDEEVEGGTWEHKKRSEEMRATLGMYICRRTLTFRKWGDVDIDLTSLWHV